MSVWTIEHAVNSGTFAELGLAKLRRTLTSQAMDVVTFEAPGADFDGDALFGYGDTVIIKKDGVRWFYGRVQTLPRYGSAQAEHITYKLAGPWWYLETCPYQQQWRLYDVDEESLALDYKSRVVLSQDADGNRITSGAQIQDAVEYAVALGVPTALGTIDPAVNLPWEETRDMSCAGVVRRMLHVSPECVAHYDYSTEPYPTLHVRRRSECAAVSLPVTGGAVQSISITPRYDLVAPGVVLRFEQSHDTEDGETYEATEVQSAGDISSSRTIVSTVPLGGISTRIFWLTQKIVTEDMPADLNDKAWWRSKIPWLADVLDDDLTIENGARDGALPRILTEGAVQDWMDVDVASETIEADCTYVMRDAGGIAIRSEKARKLSVTVTATDAATRTYAKPSGTETVESIPEGMADALYDSFKADQLYYEGDIVLLEDEVTSAVYPGLVLNVTGGRAEWASMRALVQEVSEDVDSGITTIRFGPPEQIAPHGRGLGSILRTFRTRRTTYHYNSRVSGDSSDAGNAAALSGPAPRNEIQEADGEATLLVLKHYDGETVDKRIDLDPDGADAKGKGVFVVEEDGKLIAKLGFPRFTVPS